MKPTVSIWRTSVILWDSVLLVKWDRYSQKSKLLQIIVFRFSKASIESLTFTESYATEGTQRLLTYLIKVQSVTKKFHINLLKAQLTYLLIFFSVQLIIAYKWQRLHLCCNNNFQVCGISISELIEDSFCAIK